MNLLINKLVNYNKFALHVTDVFQKVRFIRNTFKI